MSFDIPRNLNKYAEEFLFGLSLKQFLYAFATLIICFLIYMSLETKVSIVAILSLFVPVILLGILLTFFSLDEKVAAYFNLKKSLHNASYFDSSLQSFIDVAKIEDNVVYLKNGSLLAILQVTPIDFFILSSEQKKQILQSYRSWLRSIDYYVQILSRSVGVDIHTWKQQIEKRASLKEKARASSFVKWVDFQLTQSNARDRRFYIIIPVQVTSSTKNVMNEIKSIFTGKFNDTLDDAALLQAKRNLHANISNCQESMQKCHLKTHRLQTDELLGLYSSYFKNESTINKRLLSPLTWMQEQLEAKSPPHKYESILDYENNKSLKAA